MTRIREEEEDLLITYFQFHPTGSSISLWTTTTV